MNYIDEKFADIQILRYKLEGFETLSLREKLYIYYLSKAVLSGRDITFDQFGKYNLVIRRVLEQIFMCYTGMRDTADFHAFVVYLKRVWFSNGIYHHYACDKFVPGFTQEFFCEAYNQLAIDQLGLADEGEKRALLDELLPVIFDADCLPKRVIKADGVDLIETSACNFYEHVSQQEVEDYYARMKQACEGHPVSFGLNSKLVKEDGCLKELRYHAEGLYGDKIRQIIHWLKKATFYTENDLQKDIIQLLINYYQTGDLRCFDEYSIKWLEDQDSRVDFINGFIEVYGDPLGLKGSWEGIVHYKDPEATKRTRLISEHAQWFEDHSPVDKAFKKKAVRGVTANVVCAAMLGGDEYPSTAIGINLPNADWIRAEYGSKSVTIGNLTDAYQRASLGNGFLQEFVIDDATRQAIEQYGELCDNLHTDLHECLGHGSGQLLKDTDPDALKSYGNTIEEARADLFGLYYLADKKLVDLGLTPNAEAYKSQYYTYMMNGLLTQLVRIKEGDKIEEAHMRNRALIAGWALDMDQEGQAVVIEEHAGKHYVRVKDYERLRTLFATQLREIQRIKSEGDFVAARRLVEQYAVHVDGGLHKEVLSRYDKLDIAPYKGFLNPWMKPEYDKQGDIIDIKLDYSESYTHQMLRYSSEY
ncbi:MAG: dihydrofolate reductase [Segatella salivae]